MNSKNRTFSIALYLLAFCICSLVFADPHNNTPNIAPKIAPRTDAPVEKVSVDPPTIDQVMKAKMRGRASWPYVSSAGGMCQATLVGRKNGTCVAATASHCFGGRGGRYKFKTPKDLFGNVAGNVYIHPKSRGDGEIYDAAYFVFKGKACKRSEENNIPVFPLRPPGRKIPKGAQVYWSSNPWNNCGALFKGKAKVEGNHVLGIRTFDPGNTARQKNTGKKLVCGGRGGDSGGGAFLREEVDGVPNYYLLGVCSTHHGERNNKQNLGFAALYYHTGPGMRWIRNSVKRILGDDGFGKVYVKEKKEEVAPSINFVPDFKDPNLSAIIGG